MKQILFAMLSAFILLTGCSKDKEESNPLIGKWEGVTGTYKSYKNDILEEERTETFDPAELTVEFKSDNTLVSTDEDDVATSTYRIVGNTIKTKIVDSPFGDIGEEAEAQFELSNNNNTLTVRSSYVESSDNMTYRTDRKVVYKRK
jgi:hypothetical protein